MSKYEISHYIYGICILFFNYNINYTRRRSGTLRRQCVFVGKQTQLLRNYIICYINLNVE